MCMSVCAKSDTLVSVGAVCLQLFSFSPHAFPGAIAAAVALRKVNDIANTTATVRPEPMASVCLPTQSFHCCDTRFCQPE